MSKFKQTETCGERTHSTEFTPSEAEVLRVRRTIGEIPEGWEELSLSEAIEVDPKRELKKGTQAKFVSMADLKEFDKKIQGFITREFSGGPKFVNEDTLMARITPCLENGKTAFVDILEKQEVGGGSTEFIVLAAKNNKTIPEFVYYLSVSPEIRAQAIQSMTGTSGRQRVEPDVIDKIVINLPSIAEQRAIAKILSDLDEKIELNQQMNKTLESITQAIFKQWFVDFEFPGYEKTKIVDGLPEGWQVKEIKDCGEVICGKTPPTKDKENYGSDIFFITIPDMRGQVFVIKTERKLSKQGVDLQKNKNLPPLSICVSCIATPGLVSLTSVISQTNQQINSIVCKKDISPYFMYYTMVAKSEEIKSMGLGGTATLNLNTGNFAKINVLIPDDGVMNQFHNELAPLLEKVLANLRENANLCDIRDSLLPRLMSGRIRVAI